MANTKMLSRKFPTPKKVQKFFIKGLHSFSNKKLWCSFALFLIAANFVIFLNFDNSVEVLIVKKIKKKLILIFGVLLFAVRISSFFVEADSQWSVLLIFVSS